MAQLIRFPNYLLPIIIRTFPTKFCKIAIFASVHIGKISRKIPSKVESDKIYFIALTVFGGILQLGKIENYLKVASICNLYITIGFLLISVAA